jgi:hypothetical protein
MWQTGETEKQKETRVREEAKTRMLGRERMEERRGRNGEEEMEFLSFLFLCHYWNAALPYYSETS